MSRRDEAPVTPLLVSSGSAEAAVGQSWRWIRRNAALLGVPVQRVGVSSFVEAAALVETIRRMPTVVVDTAPPMSPDDLLEAMRAAMGKWRRVG